MHEWVQNHAMTQGIPTQLERGDACAGGCSRPPEPESTLKALPSSHGPPRRRRAGYAIVVASAMSAVAASAASTAHS